MRSLILLVVGLAISATACTSKEQATVEAGEEPPPPTPGVEASPVQEEEWRTDEFLRHMHRHADYLDDLNMALADDDIVAAMTPAYWLSRHDQVEGVPSEWQPYLDGVREASLDVEKSNDLESARAAAERITEQCQGCHAAAGVAG